MADDPLSRVRVDLGPRSYEIRVVDQGEARGFGPFAREALDRTWAGQSCRDVLVVTDANVAPLVDTHTAALAEVGIESKVAVLPPGETSKALERAADLYDLLVELKASRHWAIVALGGGVIGDLAGFVAATFNRGLPLLMVPTSLLAQVDSSVGGKVGVNHPRAKNVIGAFHQPTGVWIDTRTLSTLPPREFRCGLAEVVKYGMILDPVLFDELEAYAFRVLMLEPDLMQKVVARCCRLKADVVEKDEREETGLRAVLNFGHTIGHAIEAVSGYGGRYLHGEAVAVGMIAECRLAERLGWIKTPVTTRLELLVRAYGLPVRAPGLDPDALLAAMARDKKNRDAKVRFVLPRRIGQVELTDAPTENDIRVVLAEMVAS